MDADWLGASARGDSAVRPNQLTTPIWCGPTAVPSRSYAATAPSRPAVSKLRSSCQAVHVRRPNIGASPATRSPSVTMIVWPAKATPVRPDAYADCAAKIMRVVRGPASNSPKRAGGCDRPWPRLLLDHRSHAHHLGDGHWLSGVPVWVRRLWLRTRTRVYGTRTRVAVGP
jgi:hypothetical protein